MCRRRKQPARFWQYEKTGRRTAEVCEINRDRQEYEPLSLLRTAEHTRAFIKVQDGCDQFCSYCIIPYARGRVRSRALLAALDEVEALAALGYQEIVLTGIHLSSYGKDNGESLIGLIKRVHEVAGIRRIRLGSIEPRIVTEDFVRQLSALPKLCPHFHLSLQSGCDSVLARMNRRYTTAEYAKGCALLRKYFRHPAITTDVIVGFPGETEEEFRMTRDYLEKICFYEMHIFKYSAREGTRAALMQGQVEESVKAERSAELLALAEQMSERFRGDYLGQEVTALLEEPFDYGGVNYMAGYTPEYVRVAVLTEDRRANRFVTGRVSRRLAGDIYLLVEF